MRLQKLTDSPLRVGVWLRSSGCLPDVVVPFQRYMRSHIKIINGELEATKDAIYYTSYAHPFDSQRELVERSELVCFGLRCCFDSRDANLALWDSARGREAWCCQCTFRESLRPQRFSNCIAWMSHIIDFELFSRLVCFDRCLDQCVEEYDVWRVLWDPRKRLWDFQMDLWDWACNS
jgi:hypothetical protein